MSTCGNWIYRNAIKFLCIAHHVITYRDKLWLLLLKCISMRISMTCCIMSFKEIFFLLKSFGAAVKCAIENSTTEKISSLFPQLCSHSLSVSFCHCDSFIQFAICFLRWQLRKLTRQFIKEIKGKILLAIPAFTQINILRVTR